MKVFGVDFSGAVNAGKYIWLTEGTSEDGRLVIQGLERASDRWGSQLQPCLGGLAEFIAAQRDAAFGFDFPFGLPQAVMVEETWEDFVTKFSSRYTTADHFKSACQSASAGRELKRLTDIKTRTPFSPYNLRLYRQTFYGIREILAPLVIAQATCVLPMQEAVSGRPWVLEICPASTAKVHGFVFHYKGRSRDHEMARAALLEAIEAMGQLSISESVRSRMIQDKGGDAIDSLFAAVAVSHAVARPELLTCRKADPYSLEGRVYV